MADRGTLRGTVEEMRSMLDAYGRCGVDEVVLDGNTADLDAVAALMERVKKELASS